MELALTLALVAVIAWFVSAPLRHGAGGEAEDPELAELEARKEAKYREIRDAELDRAQGKLSERDWRVADAELRREAIEILRAIDRVRGGGE